MLYVPGVGTERTRLSGLIGGSGITRNLLECYEFINSNLLVGDKIFLFGFSRGAATVMSLAKFIHYIGMIPLRGRNIAQAYGIYQTNNKRLRESRFQNLVETKWSMWWNIEFVGLFDTVASLGVPFKSLDRLLDLVLPHRFHVRDSNFPESIKNAYHALAIDEERLWFQPVLWDASAYKGRLHKVWFCGGHGDVGGVYWDKKLADIPLEWMLSKAISHGIRLYKPRHPDESNFLNPDPNGQLHDSRGGALSKYYPRKIRTWDAALRGKPTIHESVLKRTLNRHNDKSTPYSPWILNEPLGHEIEQWDRLQP